MSRKGRHVFLVTTEAWKQTFHQTFALVERTTGVSARWIMSRRRDDETSFARAAACNYFMVRHGVPSTAVGKYVRRSHSTVIRIVSSLRKNKEAQRRYEQLFGRIDGKGGDIN